MAALTAARAARGDRYASITETSANYQGQVERGGPARGFLFLASG
jgi:hypothetical protein